MLEGLQTLSKGDTALSKYNMLAKTMLTKSETEQSQAKSEQMQIIWQVELASTFRVMHSPVFYYHFLLKASVSSHCNTLLSRRKTSVVKNKTVFSKFSSLEIF